MDDTTRAIVEQREPTTGDPPPGPPRETTAPEQRDVLLIDGQPVPDNARVVCDPMPPDPVFGLHWTRDGLTLARLQDEHRAWSWHNFGAGDSRNAFMGIVEEIGELAHCDLKYRQGIRGITMEEYHAKARDAVGDALIFLADYCNKTGLDMQACLETTWAEVRQRDWKKYPTDGRTC